MNLRVFYLTRRGLSDGYKRRGNGRVKKELEQSWELVIGISKRQADCF